MQIMVIQRALYTRRMPPVPRFSWGAGMAGAIRIYLLSDFYHRQSVQGGIDVSETTL